MEQQGRFSTRNGKIIVHHPDGKIQEVDNVSGQIAEILSWGYIDMDKVSREAVAATTATLRALGDED